MIFQGVWTSISRKVYINALLFSRVDGSVHELVVYTNKKYMGLDATNKVLLRFKSACSATVTSWKIKISLEANSDMMLSKRRITRAQIGPRRSAPLLFALSAPKTSFLALRTLC